MGDDDLHNENSRYTDSDNINNINFIKMQFLKYIFIQIDCSDPIKCAFHPHSFVQLSWYSHKCKDAKDTILLPVYTIQSIQHLVDHHENMLHVFTTIVMVFYLHKEHSICLKYILKSIPKMYMYILVYVYTHNY